jgi:hypothetical protein
MIQYRLGVKILEKLNCGKRRWNMGRYVRIILTALLIVCGVFVYLPSGYVSAGGMICNQSFEEGAGEVIYVGNWTARITGNNDTLTEWLFIGNLGLPVTFEAWGWIYVSGEVNGVIAIDFWAGVNGTQVSPTTELSANNTDGIYVQRTGMMQSPVGANCTRIRLMGTDWHEGAEVRFDEIGFWMPMGGYCFIATAAYGTETADELDILRDFRDQVLLKNALGSRFVEAYYKVSPPVADFIAKNDFLRAVVREVLIDPIVNLLQWSQGLWRA